MFGINKRSSKCNAKTCKNRRCKNNLYNKDYCWIHREQDPIICNICLEHMVDKVTLTCKHKFCRECIMHWMCVQHGNDSCPCCRREITDTMLYVRSTFYGQRKKILANVVCHHFTISTLSDEDLKIIEELDIKTLHFYTEIQWNVIKLNLKLIWDKIQPPTIKYSFIKTNEIDFEYLNNVSLFFLN